MFETVGKVPLNSPEPVDDAGEQLATRFALGRHVPEHFGGIHDAAGVRNGAFVRLSQIFNPSSGTSS